MATVLEMPKALGELKARRMQRNAIKSQTPEEHKAKQVEEARRSLLAKVHIARKQLGLAPDEYQSILECRFNVASSAELDVPALHKLVAYFKSLGWKPGRGPGTRARQKAPHTIEHDETGQGRERYMAKIEALLADIGRLEGRFMPWAYASGILKRQTGLDRLEYATRGQLQAIISVLDKRLATLTKEMASAT